MKAPKALSVGEETLAQHLNAYGIKYEREYVFHDGRKWRFDFSLPWLKIGIEVDGGTKRGNSRHSRGSGYEEDCRKLNQAALDGWKVIRFTTQMVLSGEAIDTILIAIGITEG